MDLWQLKKKAELLNQNPSMGNVFNVIVEIVEAITELHPEKVQAPKVATDDVAEVETIEVKKRDRKKKNV